MCSEWRKVSSSYQERKKYNEGYTTSSSIEKKEGINWEKVRDMVRERIKIAIENKLSYEETFISVVNKLAPGLGIFKGEIKETPSQKITYLNIEEIDHPNYRKLIGIFEEELAIQAQRITSSVIKKEGELKEVETALKRDSSTKEKIELVEQIFEIVKGLDKIQKEKLARYVFAILEPFTVKKSRINELISERRRITGKSYLELKEEYYKELLNKEEVELRSLIFKILGELEYAGDHRINERIFWTIINEYSSTIPSYARKEKDPSPEVRIAA
ncbi:MAG TPA: hypothetical protein ENI51_02450, partial [Candidatus Atribacteria bacterium]|nr:hypothetical protein [Candidatus Atribacteria bacterium]